MPRPPRVQEPDLINHVYARGNRSSALFLDVYDYRVFLAIVGIVVEEHEWDLHSFCLMTTHYHLLFTTPHGDLAAGMHRINSRYAHWFNDVHGEIGHVFKSRYGSVPVRRDEHLQWLYHYIAYNPVKAGMCARPEDHRWSSYAAIRRCSPIELPASEHSFLRHFGPGERGRRELRRCVEMTVEPPADWDLPGAWHRTRCEMYTPSADELIKARVSPDVAARVDGMAFYRKRRCPRCNQTGYKGRIGIYQLLAMTETLETLAVAKASREELERAALGEGMKTLWDDGLAKVSAGLTSIEELTRVTV